jgi:GntR family transcriptional regulator, rspAB operon transcriptional repressor
MKNPLDKFFASGYSIPIMMKLVIKKGLPIRKKVYNYLREQILNGLIPPNALLIETKIAKEIGASRTPVREALHSLELEKLIKSTPSVGYVVRPMSEEEVKQICEIRGLIEGLAARWAIEKAHEKLVKELAKNIAAAENEVVNGNIKTFIELDAQFHEIIAKLSSSERLLELAQTLRRHMLIYRTQSIILKDVVLRAIDGHKRILEAIKVKDIYGVGKAINYHIEQSLKDTLRFVLKEDMDKDKIQ